MSLNSPVTCVLTSSNRHDLLIQTINSFWKFNRYPLAKFIVVEDGPPIPDTIKSLIINADQIKWIDTGRRVGQTAAIDYAYSRVRTPYIFHIEDDWEFYQSGFIEDSLPILQSQPKCLQVWIRSLTDTNGHAVLEKVHYSQEIAWRRMALSYKTEWGEWHGFSWNPGLRRLRDYQSIQGYGIHGRFRPGSERLKSEQVISRIYRSRDFFAAILATHQGAGYVRHIGGNRTVNHQLDDAQ